MRALHVTLLAAAALLADTNTTAIYKDAAPKAVINEDLHVMQEFEALAYEIAEEQREQHINIGEVFRYVWRNRLHVDDYTRLNVAAVGEVGRRTARSSGEGDQTADGDLFPEDFNYYRAGIAIKYDLYDEKTERDITNKTVDYKSKIIDMAEKYADAKGKLGRLHVELKYERLNQLRDKVMQKTAQKYLDDRLKTIGAIMKLNNDIHEQEVTCNALRLQLLNLVEQTARPGLEVLL